MYKKVSLKVVLSLVLFFLINPVYAVELVFSLTPDLTFPFLTKGAQKYETLGYGFMFDTQVAVLDYLDVGTTAGFYGFPKKSSSKFKDDQSKNVFFVPLGVKAGTTFYPVSRLMLSAGFSTGFSLAVSGDDTHYQPWYRLDGSAAFRINPSFSIGLSLSWLDFQYNSWFKNPLMSGLSAGISITYRYDTRKTSGSIDAAAEYDDSIFPVLYSVYKDNSFGSVTISNDETSEIRNVQVSVRSSGYTASEIQCASIPVIRKHDSKTIPLIADFSEAILGFTENGQIPAEIVVNYEILGQKRTSVSQIIIPVYNRNQMRWVDPDVVASYVSASSQEVMEYSKYLAGIARRYLRTGLNSNMQFAMYLFEGMKNSGIIYEPDVSTPYDSFHEDVNGLDSIQYPYQTMLYKSGEKDDIGILLMSLLESVGIKTSFITAQNDFIVLFNTEIKEAQANNYFNGNDKIFIIDDYVWLPLSMKSISEGFINSWYKAVEEIDRINELELDYNFVDIAQAWTSYPPAGFSSGETVSLETAEKNLYNTVETDISRYITAEFGPQITAVQNKIKKEGASSTLYNQLGMLYVRAGMYSNAVQIFQLSAKMGSSAAMNNLGNIASLEKKYEEALKWYKKALEIDPQNATAISNINRIQSELEDK